MEVDVIIISYAKNEEFKKITEDCVLSLISSESSIEFNVFIIESNRRESFLNLQKFKKVRVIYPESEFGYNKYLNIGLNLGNSDYVCLCNNDLIFKKNWASALISAMEKNPNLLSASPYSTVPHKTKFNLNVSDSIEYGYRIRRHLAGWCIFQKRKIYETIGQLDERFTFWYADNDYSETLKKRGILHGLVLNSVVEHIESKTINSEQITTRQKLTKDQKKIFDLKWNN